MSDITPVFTTYLQTILLVMGTLMLISLLLFFLVIGFAVRQVRKLHIPADADFVETIRIAPLTIVVAIDLLDFALDIFAAPFTWIILDRLGLKALRGASVAQALIPATQMLPVLTVTWVAVRVLNIKSDSQLARLGRLP